MQIFLTTANIDEIEALLSLGVIDGVIASTHDLHGDTREDRDIDAKQLARRIAPRHLHIEIPSDERDKMVWQARRLRCIAYNIVPMVGAQDHESLRSSLEVVRFLEDENIPVNCTICDSFGEAVLAVKAGASYISLYGRRMNNGRRQALIQKVRQWLDLWGYTAKIVVQGIRDADEMEQASLAGAHILALSPQAVTRLLEVPMHYE